MASKRKRGRGRRGKSRRRNPGMIDYPIAGLIGAGLGAVGVAIATAMRVSTAQEVYDVAPGPDGVSALLGYVAPKDTPGMAIMKGALRGALLGSAVGVTTALVANEMGMSPLGRMMNPGSAVSGIVLGSVMGTATLLGDHAVGKAIQAAA